MVAVNYVYQFSILTLLVGVLRVPFNALIMAREKMGIYAIFGFVEVLLKLLIVYLLLVFSYDKLILYAILTFLATVTITFAYVLYCKKNFKETNYNFYYDKLFYRKVISFSGWNLLGNLAKLSKEQGINIMLNLVFGTILNAAYGITLSVQSAVFSFVTNFQSAVNPQIIMSYASSDYERSRKLIFQSSKLSFYLLFLIVVCLIFNIDFILELWLKNPPRFTSVLTSLCLVNMLIDSISGPLMIGIQATGEMKWYQIVVGGLILLNLPISYLLLKVYSKPEIIYFVSILISIIALFCRLYFLKKHYPPLSIMDFFKNVILKVLSVSVITVMLFMIINSTLTSLNDWSIFIIRLMVLLVLSLSVTIVVGMTKSERVFVKQLILKRLKR